MAVVRREGDWRLEKRESSVYEITYQKSPQMKVLTSDYRSGPMDDPLIEPIPVREVGSYSGAEGLFEEMVHGPPPTSLGLLDGGGMSSTDTDFGGLGGELDLGSREDDTFEELDLPPGGVAVVLILAGGLIVSQSAFNPRSTVFLIGATMAVGGGAILAWACVLYRTKGWSVAVDFLVETAEDTPNDSSPNDSKSTPPAPEKLKNTLIFDRAGQQCEWCEDRFDHPHVHHIKPRREGGPNDPENLVVLCPNCHEKADRGAIPRSKLKAKVRRLPNVTIY